MEIVIIGAIIALIMASKKKTPVDPDPGTGTGTGTEDPKTVGYFFKPAFVDTVPKNQVNYPADKWSIKNNEFYYEFTYFDGTVYWKTPLVIAFDKKQVPIYPEALQRLKEFWAIDSATLKQAAMYEFNQNPANMRDYNGPVPHFKYNNLRDLVNLVLFLRKEPRLFEPITTDFVPPSWVPGNPTPYCNSDGTYYWYEDSKGNRSQGRCTAQSAGKVYPYKPVNWSKWASGAWDPTKTTGGVRVDPNTGGGDAAKTPDGIDDRIDPGSGTYVKVGGNKRINKMFLRK